MAEEKGKSNTGVIVFFVILAVLIIGFIFLASWQVPYVVKEDYTEKVPQTQQQCDNIALTAKVQKGECINRATGFLGFIGNHPASYSCSITNYDTEAGSFSMTIGFNVKGQQLSETQSKYIYPQTTEQFSISRESDIDNCFCNEQIPTKQVCHDVIVMVDQTKTTDKTLYCSALSKLTGSC